MASLDFDAEQHEPSGSFEAMPAGWYRGMVVESEIVPTKAEDGEYLKLTIEFIDEGSFKGRRVWARLCLSHPNPQTVSIAKGQLSALCRAVGVMRPKDSSDLHDLPFMVKINAKPRGDTGEMGNDVTAFKAIGGQGEALATAMTGRRVAPAAAPAAKPKKAAPWENKAPAKGK